MGCVFLQIKPKKRCEIVNYGKNVGLAKHWKVFSGLLLHVHRPLAFRDSGNNANAVIEQIKNINATEIDLFATCAQRKNGGSTIVS